MIQRVQGARGRGRAYLGHAVHLQAQGVDHYGEGVAKRDDQPRRKIVG